MHYTFTFTNAIHAITPSRKKTFLFVSLFLFLFSITQSQESVIVFSQSFDNAVNTTPWGKNYALGFFANSQLVSVPGKGQALQFNFPEGALGSSAGCGNYKLCLDSLYRELYFSWEYYIPGDFDYGYEDGYGGGKFFGGFSGGSVTKIPNNDTTDYDGWISMLIFQNGNYRTYNYFKSTSYTSDGWPNGQFVANLVKGEWRRITIRAKINDGDNANGIYEVFDNDVLAFSQTGVKFVNGIHPEYLIDALDLNLFFGGGSTPYKSPKSQYMRFDNLVAYYYPPSSSGYRSGASESGRKLSIPQCIDKCPESPNHFDEVNYTDANGVIESHHAFYQPVTNENFQTSVITIPDATTINIDVTKFIPDNGQTYSSCMQVLRIYSGTGNSKTLIRTYDRNNKTLASHTINGNSATIEWQAGRGFNNGFTLVYASNGTGSGSNPVYPSGYIAKSTGGILSWPPVQTPPATPVNLSVAEKTVSGISLTWSVPEGSQSSLELQRLSAEGTVLQSIVLDKSVTSYTDANLLSDTEYRYRIRSYNGSVYSSFSATVNARTLQEILPPSSPSGLQLQEKDSESVSLKWSVPSGSLTSLELQRLSADGSLLKSISLDPVLTSFTDTGLISETEYGYQIRSTDGVSWSGFSNLISVITSSVQLPPVIRDDSSSASPFIAYWPLEEGTGNIATDVSGNDHNAELFNYVSFSNDRTIGDYSLEFDGMDDYIDGGIIDLGNVFTIAMWVKISDDSPMIRTLFANSSSGAPQDGIRIGINTYGLADRKINVMTGNGLIYNDAKSDEGVFELNRWNHIAVCVNRNEGEARIYYNGNNVTADSLIQNDFKTSGPVNIGRMLNGNFLFSGNLDDIRIYSHQLSRLEILALLMGNQNHPVTDPDDNSDDSAGKISDINNAFKLSESLTVFPNPSHGIIHLRLEENNGLVPAVISISDISGKIVYSESENELTDKTIDITRYGKGIYFLTVETSRSRITRKLAIQ